MKILNLARKYAEILNSDAYHKNMLFIYIYIYMMTVFQHLTIKFQQLGMEAWEYILNYQYLF